MKLTYDGSFLTLELFLQPGIVFAVLDVLVEVSFPCKGSITNVATKRPYFIMNRIHMPLIISFTSKLFAAQLTIQRFPIFVNSFNVRISTCNLTEFLKTIFTLVKLQFFVNFVEVFVSAGSPIEL
jgi:hypothetical protein